ncbi:FAD-dependent oxidoreductase [Sinorhizobium meliloti]
MRVTGITVKDGTVRGVETDRGDIAAEIVVNCAGQWARKVGLMCGVTVPPALGRAHVYRYRQDRGGASGPAGAARPGRLHLFQGGSRRSRHGRLRAGS